MSIGIMCVFVCVWVFVFPILNTLGSKKKMEEVWIQVSRDFFFGWVGFDKSYRIWQIPTWIGLPVEGWQIVSKLS